MMLARNIAGQLGSLLAVIAGFGLAGCNPLEVGGTISGLTASGLVLVNGNDTVRPLANATSFVFPTVMKSGAQYDVQVQTQPTGLSCSVANGVGVIQTAPVTNVVVTCVPAFAKLPDWGTYQGNASHTGYVPVTVDVTKMTKLWQWKTPDQGVSLTTVATTNDQVFVANSGYFAISEKLYALKETDGSMVWSKEFGSLYALNPPATSNGKVYIASSQGLSNQGPSIPPNLWSLNAKDGSVLFRTPFNAQWEHYLAPTISGDKIYFDGGTYGGMYAVNIADGTQAWFQSAFEQYDSWTPAVDDKYAYAYVGKTFTALNISDGSVAFKIADATTDWVANPNTAPVLGGNGDVILINLPNQTNSLRSYNIAAQKLTWSVAGQFASIPAVANNVIYVTNAAPLRLEARSETDGSLLWSWTPPDAATTSFIGNVLVTDNVVFIGTNTGTVGVDLTTHAPVWSFASAGNYAISANGNLYISTTDTLFSFAIR